MYALMWPNDPEPDISSTFRSKADQNREVKEGSSKLLWPHSTHNHSYGGAPASMALDFYFAVGGKAVYPRPWMERVINLSRLVGLFSGSTWGWDAPHLALCEKADDWVGDKVILPPLPNLPKLAESSRLQPLIRYHDSAGTPILNEGKGDILIRVSHDPERNDPLVLDIRYDKKEE